MKQYGNIIEEQKRRGFIEQVDDNSHAMNLHYIPHHPVKKESSTTPIRIVYDCSCKQTSDSPSLNDCLHSGPPSLNDLCAILLRFRLHSFAFSADIEKAFLHVLLDEADRDCTRFLWLSDPTDENSPFVTYRFQVVLFGATSSPFMLHAALTFHLTQNITVVSQDLLHNLYVDNIVSGCSNERAGVEYFIESRSLLNKAGFNLRSWSSNCTQLQNVASQHKVSEPNNQVKVLGVFWNTQKDLVYLTPSTNAVSSAITKRDILRWSSSIFDPLGFISPVVIPAKILIQQLWQQHVGWDTVLNADLHAKWHFIATNITQGTSLSFPRKYNAVIPAPEDASTTLHVFADASPKAFGAAAYIQKDQNPASLVMSKSRTAPLKQLTLPKLELKAAVLATKLSLFITTSLNINCTLYLWSDSQIVLYWISSQKTLKPFVSHRVNQIRSISTCWNYCPSADNPADLLTRGVTFQQLQSSTIWKQGPSWLTLRDLWPRWEPNEVLTTQLLIESEEGEPHNQSTQDSQADFLKVMDIKRYSCLQRLLAVTAYVLRFTNTIRRINSTNTKHLTTVELASANLKWIHAVQHEAFLMEISNLKSQSHRLPLVRQLRLFLDDSQLIRCGGRIHNAPLSDLVKFPYLLPSKHHFTNLVILQVHIAQHHSGVNSTLTTIHQQYWIPSGRQRVRSLLRKCVICRKATGKAYRIPDPPPLVKCRVSRTQPFEVTGVDFTGVLYVRGREGEHKVYICLFTCAVSRAVHLEIVVELTMECFLQAFRRFASRRSLPRLMLSDNASTYSAAAEELQKLFSSAALTENLCRRGVEWRFIPKRAPWFGGFWERLIALTKSALKKVLGRTHATLESLQTIVVEVEAVLNNRPLTYNSSDITDAEPITPSHLLHGRPIVSLPHRHVQDDEIADPTYGETGDIERRAKIQSQILLHFWNRWSKEYLTALRKFHRVSGTNMQTVKTGDVILIHDDTPRINWRLAVVERLNKGADGFVRSADIRTSTGRTNRPIARLYPLEVTAAEIPSTDGESARKESATITGQETQPRPVRDSALRGRHKVQQWTDNLQAPPEDVVDW